jgi:tetratricopeptide (TPR) repeat protein
MLTIKKRRFALQALAIVLAASLTACGPPGARDLRKGEQLIQNRDFEAAIPVLNDAVQILHGSSPTVEATAWNLAGLAYHGAGQLDMASRAYLQALKLDRNLWAADYNLGCLRLEESNFPAAIDYLTTYTTSHPRDVNGVLMLGQARLKLALTSAAYERGRQLEGARQDYEYTEKLHPTAEAANALGFIELQSRNPSMASAQMSVSLFKLALQREPDYSPALLNLAIVLQRYLNQPREALDAYRQYLALQPVPPDIDDVEKIAHQLDIDLRITIVAQHPPPPAAPTNFPPPRQAPPPVEHQVSKPVYQPSPKEARAERLAESQEYSPPPANPSRGATAAVQPSTQPRTPVAVAPAPRQQAAPSVPETTAETSVANPPEEKKSGLIHKLNPLNWFSGRSRKTDETETPVPPEVENGEHYTYPLPVLPIPGDRKRAEQLTSDGRQAERASNLKEALGDYREATIADPTYFDAQLALGLAAIDAKRYSSALDALGQALTLQADSADARYAFAWVLGKRGYYQDAASELRKLLSEHPEEARARLLLGNFYAENLGQPKLAREEYLKALDLLGPDSPQAGVIRTWLAQHP